MGLITTDPAKYGDSDNTLLLKWATMVQGGITPPVPVNTLAPTIEGVSSLGNEVSCTTGNWTNDPTSYTYQWFLNGAPIGGATASTWVVAGSVEDEFYCEVTAHNAAGASVPAQSNMDVIQEPLAGITWAARLQAHNGDNVPLGLYQDVACTTPATQDFDPIAAWRGEFATGTVTASQSDEAKQPYLLFVGAVPTVVFDGVDDELAVASIVGVTTTTIFAAGQFDVVDEIMYFVDGIGVSNRNAIIWYKSTVVPANQGVMFAGVEAGFPLTQGADHVVAVNFNGASSAAYVDGALAASADAGAQTLTGLTIGNNYQHNRALSGSLYSVLVPTTLLSAPNRAIVETYLTNLLP